MKSIMVVCNVHKLFREGKSYTKDGKKLVRSEIVIPRAYVEEKNFNWKSNGQWHIIDEEATDEYYRKGEIKRQKRLNEDKTTEQLKEVLLETLTPKKSKPAKKVEVNDSELEDLKSQYLEKFEKKPHHLWGVKTLKEKLQ